MEETKELVRQFYQDDRGNPLELTPGQLEIFDAIAMKHVPGQENTLRKRVHAEAFTRYGKSNTSGIAVLTRASSFPEKWGIVAGTKEKAKIIMGYVNQHIFDNDYTRHRFILDKGESMESVRRFRNKNHITFDLSDKGKNLIGEIFIASGKDALGLGAANVLEDEAALIDNNDHSLILRMLGDNPDENFLMKIGNSLARNHFLDSRYDPNYYKIIIDCYKGLQEGRINQETIDENRPFAFFKNLYECIPPSAEEMDESGWMYLITDQDLITAKERVQEGFGTGRLGVDVARGGRNSNVWVLRTENEAKVIRKNHEPDLMIVANDTRDVMEKYNIRPEETYVDDTGVGGGVTDRLNQIGLKITPVRLGEKATDTDFENIRSEIYAGKVGLQPWIKRTGKLVDHEGWTELLSIRYKKNSRGKTIIESKDDMRKRGVESPDVADALALTFTPRIKPKIYHPVDPSVILSGGIKPIIPGIG